MSIEYGMGELKELAVLVGQGERRGLVKELMSSSVSSSKQDILTVSSFSPSRISFAPFFIN